MHEFETSHDHAAAEAGEPEIGASFRASRRTTTAPPRTTSATVDVRSMLQKFAHGVNAGVHDPIDEHAIAARGVSGTGGALPFIDDVQRAFGRHDVRGVRAHVGGVAADSASAIGARAYATGSTVAFAAAPDLRLVAHEAAHVVQQRGGVQLSSGVGTRGDVYEQHADAVADAVVRGDGVEELLDRFAGGGARSSAVQKFGDHESDTMRAHRTRDESRARHGDGTPRGPGTRDELADELVRETLHQHAGTGSHVPLDYVDRCLHTRSEHAHVAAAFDAVLDGAPATSWDDQMAAIEHGAASVSRAADLEWVHDPHASGLDVLGQGAAPYRSGWDDNDYPGGPVGPHEGRARRLAHDMDEVVPEHRANQGPDAAATRQEFEHDAALRAYITAHLQDVPAFSHPLPGTDQVPAQPHERLLDTALASFVRMRDAAVADGVALVVRDGFRSFDAAQAHAHTSGNPEAVASYSSHTLGLAVDLDVGRALETVPMSGVVAMRGSESHRWMLLHGREFGWYPYENEPWHWEYNPPGFRDQLQHMIHGGGATGPDVHGDGGVRGDAREVHAHAQRGVAGSAQLLPHTVAIQRSFGHHDVSGVRAHVGGSAADAAHAIGARAYATGDDVAFAASPDLRQAAHEAAHVVQQRGGVRLDGGVGRSGDAFEQHADAVADLVVQGRSAETLLDRHAHRGVSGGAAVQRLDSHDVVGNTMSATTESRRDGTLDARSQRRLFERLAQLEHHDPTAAGTQFEAMPEAARASALHDAIERFQTSEQGQALISQISEDNAVTRSDGSAFYDPPAHGRHSPYTAPRAAAARPGEAALDDVTMQAVASAWPQTMFGREMNESQAFATLRRLVQARGLPFEAAGLNVVGMRAYQGGAIHDNGEPEHRVFTRQERYDDTTFILAPDGHVTPSRATVDPGTDTGHTFQVAADQQWDYTGNSRGDSTKYDRPIYGLAEPSTVARGRYWTEHQDELARLLEHGEGRVITRSDGRSETDRDAHGRARLVSAVHSGGDGQADGETVRGDSVGCSVVDGRWFPHFNETLRRAGGGDHGNVRFTYSLIDPRMFSAGELDRILDEVVPRQATAPTTAPTTPPVQRDPEPIDRLQQAIDAVADASELAPTIADLDALHETDRDRSRVFDIHIAGAVHEVRGMDLGAVRAAIASHRAAVRDPHASESAGARDPGTIEALVRDVLRAIAQTETHAHVTAGESRMHTSAGTAASFGSATQATASRTTAVLRGTTPGLSEEAREARREQAAAHGISQHDLVRADRVEHASDEVWIAIVRNGVEPSAITPAQRTASGFDDDALARMAMFGAWYRRLHARAADIASGAATQDDVVAEMAADPAAQELELRPTDVSAYLRAGSGEDRSAWQRVALAGHREEQPEGGHDARTLEGALAESATAEGGWEQSGAEYGPRIRAYLREHPDIADERMAAIAAGWNNSRASYATRVVENFRALRHSDATLAAATTSTEPATTTPTATTSTEPATTTPTAPPAG